MINFALACRLKEAGFPQNGGHGICGHCHGFQMDPQTFPHLTEEYKSNLPEYAYVPTLSELIEQCGGKAFRLSSGAYMDPELGWMARNEMVQGMEILDYPSPEEAVANLYLTIHKQ